MFSRRSFIFLFLFFFLIPNSFALISSVNNTDLFLESEGWCPNLEIEFRVYNISDYEVIDEIDEDDDLILRNISGASVKIYNGPLDSLPLLLETSTNATGHFKATFPSVNQYRIEVIPDEDDGYNDYFELFEVLKCNWVDDPIEDDDGDETATNNLLYNSSFEYLSSTVTLEIENTPINLSSTVNVKELLEGNLKSSGIEVPSNFLKAIEIGSSNNNFTELTLTIKIDDKEAFDKVQKYNTLIKKWEDQVLSINEENIIISSAEYGIYSIIQKEEEIVLEVATGESTVEDVLNENPGAFTQEESSVEPTTKTSNLTSIGLLVFGLLVIIGGVFGFIKYKKKKANSNMDIHKEEPALNAYSKTYDKTKEYVKQYKESYGKDQIYRVLVDSKVPKDIVDKVFLELYE